MSSNKRAFTLVEVLVCIGVIVVLAAISYPVVTKAKFAAKIVDSKSRLRQVHLAISLYRADWDDGAGSAPLGKLGLPDLTVLANSQRQWLGLPWQTWESACGRHPKAFVRHAFIYIPQILGERLDDFYARYGEELILLVDDQCSPPEINVENPHLTKRGLGVLLNGSLVDRTAIGDPKSPDWWTF